MAIGPYLFPDLVDVTLVSTYYHPCKRIFSSQFDESSLGRDAKGSLVLNLLTTDWVEMRTSARAARTQNYDQAPAMSWDHAVSWGRGLWVSVSDR